MQRQDRKRGTNIKFKSDINSCRNSCSLRVEFLFGVCFLSTQEMYVNAQADDSYPIQLYIPI